MNVQEEKFNKLLSIITYGEPNKNFKFSHSVSIDGENLFYNFNLIEDKEELLYDFISSINSKNIFSFEFLETQLNLFLLENAKNHTASTFRAFNDLIKKIPLKKYRIYTGIYGVQTDKTIKLGNFSIINKNEILNYLKGYNEIFIDNKLTEQQLEHFAFSETDANCFIGIEIKSYDDKRACEIARLEFLNFEKLMSFTCERNGYRPPIRIFNLVNKSTSFLLLKEKSWINNSSANPLYVGTFNYQMSNLIKEMEDNKSLFVFELYSDTNKSELKSSIITAILWIGQANVEEDINVKLLEYCFALEAILQRKQGEILSPSITYQISHSCAVINTTNYDERKKIIDNIKKVYKDRSTLAHGGSTSISTYYTNLMWQYLVKLIYNLIYNPLWNDIENTQQLWNKVEEQMLNHQ